MAVDPSPEHVDAAIDRAVASLCARQQPDGAWTTPGDVGPAATAQALVALDAVGDRDPERDDAAARWLASQQRDDGGFEPWPAAATSDPGVTATALAALARRPAHAASCTAARRFLDARGGVDAVVRRLGEGELGGYYATLGGLVARPAPGAPSALPLVCPPLLDRWTRRVHAGVPMMAACWRAVAKGPAARPTAATRLERRWSLALLDALQNADGHWNATVLQTTVALGALPSLGVDARDARVRRAVAWLRAQGREAPGGWWYPGFWLPVWSTVFAGRALVASRRAGARGSIDAATRWLRAAVSSGPQARWNQPDPGAPRAGGWAFLPRNETMPDCDDTGAALSLLGAAEPGDARGAVVRGAVAWLDGMQHANGGWASYTVGLPAKPRGPILAEPFRPRDALRHFVRHGEAPLALGDPPTEDVTARVLEGLGAVGHRVGEPRVDRALRFLREQQLDAGHWWGRWMLNYVAATAFVVLGARAVGEPAEAPWLLRAIAWLRAKQRDDGSFGEAARSYRDPALAGVGEGCAPLTGLALSALCAAGLARTDAARAAARWLLAAQRDDGTWPRGGYLTPLLLPDSFYVHEESTHAYALEGLGRWRAAHDGAES
ncbi:MAG: prenyltransferase/squalene oxidase repeat-containing protein [Polyangiales bacterium]